MDARSILRPTFGQLWSLLGFGLPALASLLVPMPAVDLAYQLRAGADILAGHGIPTVDSWTFTVAGTPWLNQQWGAQVLLALVFQLGGWTGLAILRAALVGLAFWLLGRTLRSIGSARRAAAIISLLAFGVAAPALALRPQLFAIVLFAATLWILVERRAHPRRLWLIPVIAAVWANLHGSFPLVIVLVGLAWADEAVSASGNRPHSASARARAPTSRPTRLERPVLVPTDRLPASAGLALVGAVAAFATLLNPFGIDVWRYVVSLAANPSVAGRVSEWRSPSPVDPAGAVFYGSVLVVLAVVALRVRADGGRVTPSTVAPIATVAVFAILGLVTGRGLAPWALAAPVAAATLARDAALPARLPGFLQPARAVIRPSSPALEARGSALNALFAIVLLVAAIALLPLWRPVGPAGVPTGVLSHAPQGIAAHLRDSSFRDGTRVWNPQTWGSWLEWAAPELVYAVDSRIELYPASVWDDAAAIAGGGEGAGCAIHERAPEVVIVPADQASLASALRGDGSWSETYRDSDGSVWVRAGLSAVPGCPSG